LKNVRDLFILKGNLNQDGYISIDRIIWSQKEFISADVEYYGIFAEHDSIKAKLDYNAGGHIDVWNGFSGSTSAPFYGEQVISFKPNTGTWNGFGVRSDNPLDLSNFIDGAIHFSLKTASTENIEIGFKNSVDLGWKHIYSGSGQLLRDGNWHEYQLNRKDFTPDAGTLTANDLKDITIPFYLVGTVQFAIDEIYLSANGVALVYPDIPVSANLSQDAKIRIYPNPAVNSLTISGIEENTQVCIFDKLGRKILVETISQETDIDISSLEIGNYFVQISNKEGNSVFYIVKNQ
jgi:hypothetical protein